MQPEGQKIPSENGHRTAPGKGALSNEGTKGFGDFKNCEMARRYSSKSKKRKQASAEIAKIPPALAGWIARIFKNQMVEQ